MLTDYTEMLALTPNDTKTCLQTTLKNFFVQVALMDLVQSDKDKNLQTPVVWSKYKEIINKHESAQVSNTP